MKQELIDRMEKYIRAGADEGSSIAGAIVAELDKPDYLVIAREICALACPRWAVLRDEYRSGVLDTDASVQYALEQLERAAGLRN